MSETATGSESTEKSFVVEINGERHSAHAGFADALKVALLLRDSGEHSNIKVRDLAAEMDGTGRQEAA